jgi:hypothetical protein
MNIRTMRRFSGLAAGIAGATALTVALATPSAWATPNDAAQARQGTASYHNSKVITGDSNWFQLYDVNGITCIDDPAGGMGIHFVNGSRLNDAREIASQPEAVIYEPQKNGQLRLVAVEYVVTKSAWESAGNTKAPRLYNRDFELVKEGNRYGLPDFYELHAWIWRENPNGMNEDWNPQVSCAAA